MNEIDQAITAERKRITDELLLASLRDCGGDGIVSVKMGMSEIIKIINK